MKRLLSSMLVLALSAGIAEAQSIGFNFSSDREDAALGAGESAGVAAQVNWNNWDGVPSDVTEDTTQTQADIDSPNAGVVTDSSGATHGGVTVSWTSRNAWNTNNGVGNGDNKLMNGYVDNNAGTPQVTVDVSGLPGALTGPGYDVYVYIGSDGNDRTGTVTDGTTTYSYSTFSQQGGAFPDAYQQTTDTADGFHRRTTRFSRGTPATPLALRSTVAATTQAFTGCKLWQFPSLPPSFCW